MERTMLQLAALLVLAGTSKHGQSHPSPTPHENSDATVKWELDGTKDGSSAHNHHFNRNFGGINQIFNDPYSAVGCWDNHTWRSDREGDFDLGHCYIDEANPTNIVRYAFVGSNPAMPSDAKDRIRDAFAEYSTFSSFGGNIIGIEFVEATPADITVQWTDLDDISGGGQWNSSTTELTFDRSFDWAYALDPSGIPGDKYHFYSVVLHEVGHVVGLHEQADDGDVMKGGVGQPANQDGRQFGAIDPHTAEGVRDLYAQPPPPDVQLLGGPIHNVEPEADSMAAYSGIRLHNDGNVYYPVRMGPSDYDWAEQYQWRNKPGSYWVRATVNSGSVFDTSGHEFDSISNGVWISLNGSLKPSWTVRQSANLTNDPYYESTLTKTANVTIEVATDSGGLDIIASKTLDLIAQNEWLREVSFGDTAATDVASSSSTARVVFTIYATQHGLNRYHIGVREGDASEQLTTWWQGIPGHEPASIQGRWTSVSGEWKSTTYAEGVWFNVTGGFPSDSFTLTRYGGIGGEGPGTSEVISLIEFRSTPSNTVLDSFTFTGTATITN